MDIVRNWKTGRDIEMHDDIYFDGVVIVMQARKYIVWRLFLDGCLSHEWVETQHAFYEWKGSRKSGKMGGATYYKVMGCAMGGMDVQKQYST